jgi:hypothetical protein
VDVATDGEGVATEVRVEPDDQLFPGVQVRDLQDELEILRAIVGVGSSERGAGRQELLAARHRRDAFGAVQADVASFSRLSCEVDV